MERVIMSFEMSLAKGESNALFGRKEMPLGGTIGRLCRIFFV